MFLLPSYSEALTTELRGFSQIVDGTYVVSLILD